MHVEAHSVADAQKPASQRTGVPTVQAPVIEHVPAVTSRPPAHTASEQASPGASGDQSVSSRAGSQTRHG